MICPKCGRPMWPTIWDPWFNPGTLYQVTYRCRCGQERTQAVPKNEQTMEQLNWAWAEECEWICGI